MALEQDFQAAVQGVNNMNTRPTDGELLELYALFKQGSVGDNNTPKPGLLDLKAKAKWNAWDGKKGTSQDDAKKSYIAYANEMFSKYG